jgi:hypothetical protein
LGPVAHAFLVAGRFGLLLGLAVWTGVAVATLSLAPVLYGKLERAQADEVAGGLFVRVDRLLLGALGLLAVAAVTRAVVERLMPSAFLLLPLVAMAGSRLVAAFAVGPALRALRSRLRDANAPASDAERAAHNRLRSTWLVLLSLETLLGVFGLFAVS